MQNERLPTQRGLLEILEDIHHIELHKKVQLDESLELPPNVVKSIDELHRLKIKAKKGIRTIDLFCGMGALSIGFDQAGYRSVLAIDGAHQACGTYALNRPNVPVLLTDIGNMDVAKVVKAIGGADVIVGGVPCETFSGLGVISAARWGHDIKAKPERKLIHVAMNFVRAANAKAFCFENVPLALKSPQWQKAIKAIEKDGWKVKPVIIHANDYGAATKRKRLFLIGTKVGEFDEGNITKIAGPTPKEVISNLGKPSISSTSYHVPRGEISSTVLADLKRTPKGRSMWLNRANGQGSLANAVVDSKEPAPTINTNAKFVHWNRKRYLTAREMCRIQGIPDSYKFIAKSPNRVIFLIGDSVPPPMAKQVAMGLKKHLTSAQQKAEEPYPRVAPDEFGDPKNRRYPINNYERVRAAISYFSMPKNADKYETADQKKIWARIVRAAAKFKIELSPDSGPPSIKKTLEDAPNADVVWEMPIHKVNEEEHIVTGIVLEPNIVDAQGDIVSPQTIKAAAHKFLGSYNDKTKLGYMHKKFGNIGISLVESWIARDDDRLNGKPVKKGSWLMSVKIESEALWKKCKEGGVVGFSIGGTAKVSS